MMNKFLVSLILGALPLTMVAQDDDMYFVPSKKTVKSTTTMRSSARPAPTFHSGSNRSVDEYNRRGGSYYQVLPADTAGRSAQGSNDIIDFSGELGVYPDSAAAGDDFALTREMSRWDGYEPDAYLEGYRDGRRESSLTIGWHSPWFYSSYYPWYDSYWYWHDPWYYTGWYDPWYYSWYDPWYYGYGYYRPWYHSYWYGGYYHPHYYYGGGVSHYDGPTGTQRHGRISYSSPRGVSNGRTTAYSSGRFGGRALDANRTSGTFGSTRSASTGARSTSTRSSSSRFGGNAATRTYNNSSSQSTRSYTPSTPSSSGSAGSFGGSRSSSGSFGGGSFGGSRSSGGGGGGGRLGGRR